TEDRRPIVSQRDGRELDAATTSPPEPASVAPRGERDRPNPPPGYAGPQGTEVRGQRPGTRYVRIVRPPFSRQFTSRAPGVLIASEQALRPRGVLGRFMESVRAVVIGTRIA